MKNMYFWFWGELSLLSLSLVRYALSADDLSLGFNVYIYIAFFVILEKNTPYSWL